MDLLKRPLFLVGAERSGSTMLRLMLDHHPEVAFEHEFELAVAQISDEGVFPPVENYIEWLKTVRGFHYAVDDSLEYPALVDSFLHQKNAESGFKPHVGATVHHHFHRLLHIWPDARFIHLLRDPRDVARSVVEKGWAGNVYTGARFWVEAEESWDLLSKKLQSDQAIDVRYEHLVADPESELARICRFIGVDFDAAMLRYTESAIQYPKPNATLANQWKRKSSPQEVEQVELCAGDLMRRRGYEPTHPHRNISRLQHERLTFESRVKCFGFRVKTLGIGLVMRDMIARRLGLRGMQKRMKERINAVESQLIEMEAAGKRAPSANIQPVFAAQQQSAASRPPDNSA